MAASQSELYKTGSRWSRFWASLSAAALVVGLVPAGVIAVSVVTASPAEAASITVSDDQDVKAQMASHRAADGATDAGDRIRYGSANNTTTSGYISNSGGSAGTSPGYADGYTAWVSSGTTAYTAHGYECSGWNCGSQTPSQSDTRLNLSEQSAIGFRPSSITSFEPGEYVLLGQMIHRNNAVQASSQFFLGEMNI